MFKFDREPLEPADVYEYILVISSSGKMQFLLSAKNWMQQSQQHQLIIFFSCMTLS